MFNMQKMMKQAQEMQMKLQEVQEKLADIEIDAESGGGLIKVRMNCSGKVVGVELDESLMTSDKETLEDLLTAAMNTANEVKDQRIKEETQAMMEGMGLPEGFGAGGGLPI